MAPFFLHKDFLDYLRIEKRYSAHTILAYENDIKQFSEFISIETKGEVQKLSRRDVRYWVVELVEKELELSSVHRKVSSLRRYFGWLLKEGQLEVNPAKNVQLPKKSKSLPSFVQEKEVEEEKLELVFADDFNGLRDRLMFEILYQTGIRKSELISLRLEDVGSDSIKVLGKRNKERIIPIAKELRGLIGLYLKERASLPNREVSNLLLLNNGKKMYPSFVYRKINYYLRVVANVSKKSPHVLRHTFATHLLNNGAGLEVLKELLGHANLSATQIYTHNSFSELTEIYSRSHPRGQK